MQSNFDIKEKGVSVVLGSYNRYKFLKMAIASIREELTGIPHEIIVVDGGSTDGSLSWLVKQKDIISIIQHNRNGEERRPWGYFINLGFKSAQGKYICMLSDDCLVVPGAIVNGYKLFETRLNAGEKTGAVAFYWRDWPKKQRYCVSIMNDNLYVNHGLFLNQVLQEIGYSDEINYDFYYGDVDLCMRIRQHGYNCIDSPDSYIEHYAFANINLRRSNKIYSRKDMEFFQKKWIPDTAFKPLPVLNEKDYCDRTFTVNKFKFYHRIYLLKKPFLRMSWLIKKRANRAKQTTGSRIKTSI